MRAFNECEWKPGGSCEARGSTIRDRHGGRKGKEEKTETEKVS
jgi:hypothetical protein